MRLARAGRERGARGRAGEQCGDRERGDGADDERGRPGSALAGEREGGDVHDAGVFAGDGGEAVGADDFVDFGLDFALDVWVDKTGEDEAVKNRGGGV